MRRVSQGQTTSNKLRNLLVHEQAAHGSGLMSHIPGFVVLAREGRLDGHAQRLAFDRMVEKLQGFQQPVTQLLCHKSKVTHTLSNLQEILSTDHQRPDGDMALFWEPVSAERFLWLLRPDDDNPADYQWGRVWKRLRQMYSNGHL